jgi:hypothetical protein
MKLYRFHLKFALNFRVFWAEVFLNLCYNNCNLDK